MFNNRCSISSDVCKCRCIMALLAYYLISDDIYLRKNYVQHCIVQLKFASAIMVSPQPELEPGFGVLVMRQATHCVCAHAMSYTSAAGIWLRDTWRTRLQVVLSMFSSSMECFHRTKPVHLGQNPQSECH